jgi:hypothetical protein
MYFFIIKMTYDKFYFPYPFTDTIKTSFKFLYNYKSRKEGEIWGKILQPFY